MIRVDRWSPSDGLSLEPNALTAAKEIGRSLALTAGPGAGKTEMLAQRADFLLRTATCRYPKRILAISFKVDASQNLKARVRKRCGPELAARLDSHTFHAFAKRIIDRFRPVLTGRDALDSDYSIGPVRVQRRAITFGDMVPLAVTIVESSQVARNAIRQTYSHVFLDEFQDCTEVQYRLIKACFHGTQAKLTAVGDTKQRIMGWAGALEGIFHTYAHDFAARPLNLYQNFRSKPRLRRMQNAMVRVMDPPAALNDEDIAGEEGEIEILRFDDDDREAIYLADTCRDWIDEEGIAPSEIAVLVSKQQNLYCQKLRTALEARGVPFREEDSTQDLASDPVACLIIDFLLVASGSRQPAPYGRLLDLVVFNHGFDEEREYQARSRWDRFVADVSQRIADGRTNLAEEDQLAGIVDELIRVVGRDAVVALSPDYAHGDRLQQQIEAAISRAHHLLRDSDNVATALASFSGDRAVRIMSIHKSKGLEFDTVVVLGVERETFWGDEVAERSAYFVGISRAKRRLFLTVCERRECPDGARNWRTGRTEHDEFVGYAEPYL
ncbi:UvrD-helicase domain-containing protein [Burkholderia multivorans]|uniref:UvrD-helicase domain-containing protein n=1 Tax=Burkholderia multivorans TaxID=87883 RepID=UPI000278209C|nr:ATP-dependent helicase [Burkholderia multivorans]EJO53880.1 UvrD/REP helicase domain protein [Burkholderia multivorans CF2]KWA36009.1 DNA helicase UvrD [Burkholderia multivorans]MBU9474639.1 ATP-dependent helicase [Burkholderia multivorans]